jgi:polyphosphate kinase
MGQIGNLKQILQSPFTLHEGVLALIENETKSAKKGKPAAIYAKMNALIEPKVIEALYRASQAGVKIKLIVRGICSLKPGLKGFSENIEVRSIIGRFLEHSRVFYFSNRGDPKIYLASSDWMERNFFRRIEIFFPIDDPVLKRRIFEESFENYLKDNTQAWKLKKDGTYKLVERKGSSYSAQEKMLKKFE